MGSDIATEIEEEKRASIVEQLAGPKKKRKSYVILALNPNFDPELSLNLQSFFKKSYPNYSLSIPKNSKELNRLFTRQIVLAVIDDNFYETPKLINNLKLLKEKQAEKGVPIIFMTDNVKNLVASYHKELLAYQEVDNYIRFRSMPLANIQSRIQSILNQKEARRSRRYKFDIPVKYMQLSKNIYYDGRIIELSVHGGILYGKNDLIFSESDQLKIHFPIAGVLHPKNGEFLRISAKVRRLLMGGNQAAVSWEYLSEDQNIKLTEFVLESINLQMLRPKK